MTIGIERIKREVREAMETRNRVFRAAGFNLRDGAWADVCGFALDHFIYERLYEAGARGDARVNGARDPSTAQWPWPMACG